MTHGRSSSIRVGIRWREGLSVGCVVLIKDGERTQGVKVFLNTDNLVLPLNKL